LEHLATVGSDADWQKKAKEYQAELRVANEQVFAQYETGFQNFVDQAIFFYRCSPDRFDVHMGWLKGNLKGFSTDSTRQPLLLLMNLNVICFVYFDITDRVRSASWSIALDRLLCHFLTNIHMYMAFNFFLSICWLNLLSSLLLAIDHLVFIYRCCWRSTIQSLFIVVWLGRSTYPLIV